MSFIGSPIDTSLLQTAQAQQVAAKARDRERAITERGRRRQDFVDLRVAGTEASEAIRKLPQNDSEQAESEHESQDHPPRKRRDDEEHPRIDVRA